ncbi:MAG: insulinase family protein [Syntrophales bacterium]|nr:insulinase family protein [Syntrophales bacterium]
MTTRKILLMTFVSVLFSLIGTTETFPWMEQYRHPDTFSFKPLNFVPPKPHRFVLKNGLTIFVMEDHTVPLVDIQITIGAGSYFEPIGKEGLAELTAEAIKTGGTKTLPPRSVDEFLDFTGSTLKTSVSYEMVTFSLNCLREEWKKGIQLLYDMMSAPLMDETRIKLSKELMIEDLLRLKDDPWRLSFREFTCALYGSDPRGRKSTPESIKNITRDDLLSFHQEYFYPENMIIAITGDVTVSEVATECERLFGGLKLTGKSRKVTPPPEKTKPGIYYVIKELPQSIIIAGHIAPGKSDSYYFPFKILDLIVGSGGFTSKLTQEIRTSKGLAYSAGSFYKTRAHHGVFAVYGATSNDNTVKVLRRIIDILSAIKAGQISKVEVEKTKKTFLNRFIFEFQTPNQITYRELVREFYGLPEDFYKVYPLRIESLNLNDIIKTAQVTIKPTELTILVLGPERYLKHLKEIFKNTYECRVVVP